MNDTVKKGKNMAIVAYLTFVGTLIAWSMNTEAKNEFASVHIRQAIGLDLLFLVFAILISGFDRWYVTFPFWLVFIVLWGFGFIGALQGKVAIVPFVGDFFQKWLKKIA